MQLPFPLSHPIPEQPLLCVRCETTKLPAQFPEASNKEGRGNICYECLLNERRSAIIKRKNETEKTIFNALMGQMRKPIDAPHISEMVEQVMTCFGGTQAFAEFYHDQIIKASVRAPGSKTVLDGCKAIAQMVSQSTKHRHTAPDVSMLTDEDLEREAKALVLTLHEPDSAPLLNNG